MSIVYELNDSSNKINNEIIKIENQINNIIKCFVDAIENNDKYSRDSLLIWLKVQKNELIDISNKLK